MSRKYLLWLSISGLFLCVDQLTKLTVHLGFKLNESLAIIPNYFNLTYVRNYGAAFGFLASTSPSFREFFFLAVPPAVLIGVFALLRKTEPSDRRKIIALSLVFAGALGNYIDRLKYRYVIDFLDFHYQNTYSWPAFNVADACIVIGIAVLILLVAKEKKADA